MVALVVALLLRLLVAAAVSAAPRRPAAVPSDCSLNGEYVAGRCQPSVRSHVGQARLLPAEP
eukprot:COSAG06_NODE_3593_length_5143_cov_2.358247_1_plen_62_part_00